MSPQSGTALFTLACFIPLLVGVKSNGLTYEEAAKLSSYSIVYPELVHHKWKRHVDNTEKLEVQEDKVTYSLSIEGQPHLLHLEKNKDFLAKGFVQYSYDISGKLITSYPQVHRNCHYHGYVEGYEDSLVALSTYQGLRGIIFIGQDGYGIEPAIKSTTNEHFLFPLTHNQHEVSICGVTDEMFWPENHTLSMTRFLRKKRNLPQTRYVELALVVDKNRYDLKSGNMTAIQEEMVTLANLMDGYYKELNIRVALVGLEIMSAGNPFEVTGSAGAVLSNFVSWRKTSLSPRIRNDVAQLVVGLPSSYPGGILGMAFVGTVCSASSSGGISVYSNNNLGYFSTIVAHEMGHNLGMNHDDNRCKCNGSACIMYSYASGSTLFSTCSGNDFESLILQGGGICLNNIPTNAISVPSCGNGIVENGEQCDCGTPQECTNKCCNPNTCQLTQGSTCAVGSCCQNCQVKVAGTPCRLSVDVCDLPEFCTGQSGSCPSDYYVMDGLPCQNYSAYCYEGRCQTYDFQCQHLFDSGAKKAADVCFNVINANGDKYGNCGIQGSSYIKCSQANSMCGKVQCTNVNLQTLPQGASVSLQTIQGSTCVNADFNLGSDVRDPAYVNPGSICASGKTCIDFQCVNATEMKPNLTCTAQGTCNGNGVCNNLGNCHCNNGWVPPSCNRAGFGGSINSGPAQIDYSLRNGLLIFFLLVVPILIGIILALLYVFKRDSLKQCFKCRPRSQSPRNNNANGNLQRNTTPQPEVQAPKRPQQSLPGPVLDFLPRYDEANYTENTIPHLPQRQGPGVPKPIPPKQNQPV